MREWPDRRRHCRSGYAFRRRELYGDAGGRRDDSERVGQREDRLEREDEALDVVKGDALEVFGRCLVMMMSCAVTVHDLLVHAVTVAFVHVRRRCQRHDGHAGGEHERCYGRQLHPTACYETRAAGATEIS